MERRNTERKSSLWGGNLIAVAISAVGILIFLVLLATTAMAKEPEWEEHYYDLSYTQLSDDDGIHKLCSELAAEGACTFQPDGYYQIYFELPNEVQRNLLAGHHNYEISVGYDAEVAAGKFGYLQIRVTDPDAKQIYIAQSSFSAQTEITLEHRLFMDPKGNLIALSSTSDSAYPSYIFFWLKTSTAIGAEPQETDFTNSFGNWHFAGQIPDAE